MSNLEHFPPFSSKFANEFYFFHLPVAIEAGMCVFNMHYYVCVCNELDICLSLRWDLNPSLSLVQIFCRWVRYQSAQGKLAQSQDLTFKAHFPHSNHIIFWV